MKKKRILDTNFILRYLLKDNLSQYNKAKTIFDLASEGKTSIILEQPVFMEVIYVLSSYYEVPKDEVICVIYNLISLPGVISDRSVLEASLTIFKKHNIHIVDAFLIAKSKMNNIELMSFDKKLLKIYNSIAEC